MADHFNALLLENVTIVLRLDRGYKIIIFTKVDDYIMCKVYDKRKAWIATGIFASFTLAAGRDLLNYLLPGQNVAQEMQVQVDVRLFRPGR